MAGAEEEGMRGRESEGEGRVKGKGGAKGRGGKGEKGNE